MPKKNSTPRIAIISDIHANIDALEAVLADIDRRGIKEILCLGDIVGYGAAPAVSAVPPRDLKAWLTFPSAWGPTEWGPLPFLPPADILVRRMEAQWGDLDR